MTRKHDTLVLSLLVVPVILLGLLSGCETLKTLQLWKSPDARVREVAITGLSFEGAEITTDIEISNPNAIGIDLAGLEYQLVVEGSPFVGGEIDQKLSIEAQGTSTIAVPVAVTFLDLRDAIAAVGDKDELAYEVVVELRFDLPILGVVALPLSVEGTLPVVNPPRVEVARLTLDSITLTKANATLTVELGNPNVFGFRILDFEYGFIVKERPWIEGELATSLNVQPKSSAVVEIPFSLGFLEVGLAVRDILLGDSDVDYQFFARLDVATTLDLIPSTTIPIEFGGSIPVLR